MNKRTRVILLATLIIVVVAGTAALILFGPKGFTRVADDQMQRSAEMGVLTVKMAVDAHWLGEGSLPARLADLTSLTPADLRDPWGHDLRYTPTGPKAYTLCSAGPDGAFDTADDLCRSRAPSR